MKKWLCGILLLVLISACALALADDTPTLDFVEKERINYKPIISGGRKELSVDTWLQQLVVNNEDYFWSADPDGPVYEVKQTSGSKVKTHIDSERVLRMDTALSKTGKVTFSVKVTWAGQTATTNVYIKFFKCSMPKYIGFDDEITIYTGQTRKLKSNYDKGAWKYRDWVSLYPQHGGDDVFDVWYSESSTGACTYIRGLKAGKSTLHVQANQNGLAWDKTIKIRVVDFTDAQGNKYKLNTDGKTAVLRKGTKSAASVKIPDSITVGSKKYKVTEIAKKAFSKNTKIVSLTIGKNVAKIGAKAFYKCSRLAKITVKTKKLTSVGAEAFKSIVKKAVFKCPSSALAKTYRAIFRKAGVSSKSTFK